ncbi:hypothetical protein ACOSQ4_009450 [Xanthoceras sorbifolium]
MRKQASGKAIKKHMRNGGMNSFKFHLSPRMVPHIIKPEVQLVELSIEQFVSRGKKVKGDQAIETPVCKDKLTVAESEIIAKYFHPTSSNLGPSLIAFPHFQTFPSGVHKVMHSYRTGMLIDLMQHLQGLTFSRDGISFLEDEVASSKCLGVQTECEKKDEKDSLILDDIQGSKSPKQVTYSELSPIGTLRTKEKHSMPHFYETSPAAHAYLFGSDFVSVDALGNVLIVSLPSLPFEELSHSKSTIVSNTLVLNHMKQDSFHLKASDGNCNEITMQDKAVAEVTTSQTTYIKNGALRISSLCESGEQEEKMLDGFESILESPIVKRKLLNDGHIFSETLDVVEIKELSLLADEYNDDLRDTDLSPRLTNLVKSGVVPESPVNESGLLNNDERNEFLFQDLASPDKLRTEELTKSPNLGKMEGGSTDDGTTGRNVSVSPVNKETQTPLLKMKRSRGRTILSPVTEEPETSLTNVRNSSSSRDWHLSPGDKSENVEPVRKFKRLRKAVDHGKNRNPLSMNENIVVAGVKLARSSCDTSSIQNKQGKGKTKLMEDVRAFIDEEAEVSSEVEISDDEEDDQDHNSHDDSFIDDRINPTAASTQIASGGVDMMAIYRRSLLSQSPLVRQPDFSSIYSPDSAAPMTRTSESGSSSGKTLYSIQMPQIESEEQSASKNPAPVRINQEGITSETMPCATTDSIRENERSMENRKRKFSFYQSRSIPAINLEQQFSLQSEAAGIESCQQSEADKIETNGDALDDDQFYEYLDFDAVEEHAALLLKQKSEFTMHKQDITPGPKLQNLGVNDSPSFDLGI